MRWMSFSVVETTSRCLAFAFLIAAAPFFPLPLLFPGSRNPVSSYPFVAGIPYLKFFYCFLLFLQFFPNILLLLFSYYRSSLFGIFDTTRNLIFWNLVSLSFIVRIPFSSESHKYYVYNTKRLLLLLSLNIYYIHVLQSNKQILSFHAEPTSPYWNFLPPWNNIAFGSRVRPRSNNTYNNSLQSIATYFTISTCGNDTFQSTNLFNCLTSKPFASSTIVVAIIKSNYQKNKRQQQWNHSNRASAQFISLGANGCTFSSVKLHFLLIVS